MKNKKRFTAAELVVVLFIGFVFIPGCIGWGKNLMKLTRCDFEAPYKAEIIHTVGIIPVVGAITGWMNFGR